MHGIPFNVRTKFGTQRFTGNEVHTASKQILKVELHTKKPS